MLGSLHPDSSGGVDRESTKAWAQNADWHGLEILSTAAGGEKGPAIELRTTAHAALQAIQKLSPQELNARIIGIKAIHAFDSDLMVASILRGESAQHRLVGAVVVEDDPNAAAAMAVLSALNRTLGNFLQNAD